MGSSQRSRCCHWQGERIGSPSAAKEKRNKSKKHKRSQSVWRACASQEMTPSFRGILKATWFMAQITWKSFQRPHRFMGKKWAHKSQPIWILILHLHINGTSVHMLVWFLTHPFPAGLILHRQPKFHQFIEPQPGKWTNKHYVKWSGDLSWRQSGALSRQNHLAARLTVIS